MLLLRCRILNIINFYTCIYYYTRMSMRNFVYSKDLEGSCGQYSVANCRCDVSAFDLRKSMWRLSKIDVATFEDRCIALRRSTIDVTMCRPSKIDDRWPMCRPSKIDGRCEIRLLYLLKTLILYISCMRITPRVCTSVLSLFTGTTFS